MTKVIISIVSALLVLFPFSSTLLGTYQQLSFPGKHEITEEIINAVKTNDIDAIEKMLSKERKKNMDSPKDKIDEFLQTIEGEITKAEYKSGAREKDESGSGYVYSFRSWLIEFETTKNTYFVQVNWIRADTKSPDNVGMSSMLLYDNEDNRIAEIY